MNFLQDLLSDHNTEVLEEDAGALKQVPKTWWKKLTGSSVGENSEIIQIGSDIFKKSETKKGVITYAHKPVEKANRFTKLVQEALPKFKEYKDDSGWSRHPVKGIFVMIDDQPYALIDVQNPGEKANQSYAVLYHHGESEKRTEYKSRVSGRGMNRRTSHYTFERSSLTKQEVGESLPDGKCDVYFVMADADRITKRTERRAASAGQSERQTSSGKERWTKGAGLENLKKNVSKRLINAKAGDIIKDASEAITKNLTKLSSSITAAVESAQNGETISIDTSALNDITNNIRSLNRVVEALSAAVRVGRITANSSWDTQRKSYEYRNLLDAIESFKKNQGTPDPNSRY